MYDELVNYANFLASELRANMIPNIKLYRTGNMKSSVSVVSVNDDAIEVVIATDYASYTNEKGIWAGWVESTINRVSRCYSTGNDVSSEDLNGSEEEDGGN